jgi:hypothetical protein
MRAIPDTAIWLIEPPDATLDRYGIVRPSKLDAADRARLVAERAKGASLRELGRRYGVSAEAVRLALQREQAVA